MIYCILSLQLFSASFMDLQKKPERVVMSFIGSNYCIRITKRKSSLGCESRFSSCTCHFFALHYISSYCCWYCGCSNTTTAEWYLYRVQCKGCPFAWINGRHSQSLDTCTCWICVRRVFRSPPSWDWNGNLFPTRTRPKQKTKPTKMHSSSGIRHTINTDCRYCNPLHTALRSDLQNTHGRLGGDLRPQTQSKSTTNAPRWRVWLMGTLQLISNPDAD